jgi:FSR family fosmidomycin resistance protein-like MFS transporter
MAGRLSGLRLGQGLGFWIVGGYLGFAIGPIVVATTVNALGLEGTPWLLFGGWLGSVVLYLRLRGVGVEPPTSSVDSSWRQAITNMRPILAPVVGITLARALSFSATLTFLPTLLTRQGTGLWLAGIALAMVQAMGAAGALLAGSASDRLGRRPVVLLSMLSTPMLILALVSLRGWVQVPVLVGLGLTIPATHVVMMALVQERCPDNRALATGILLSVTFISESIGAVVLGVLADLYDLRLAFAVSAMVFLAGLPLVLLLPSEGPTTSRTGATP